MFLLPHWKAVLIFLSSCVRGKGANTECTNCIFAFPGEKEGRCRIQTPFSVPLCWYLRHKPDLCTFWTSLRCLFEMQVQTVHIRLGLHSNQINSCATEVRLEGLTPSGFKTWRWVVLRSGLKMEEAPGRLRWLHEGFSTLVQSLWNLSLSPWKNQPESLFFPGF